MSDQAPANTDAPAADEQPQEGEPKVFDEAYVKQLRDEAAKHRTAARTNAEAAKKLAEIEEAQKTETQKAADRLAEAEAKASKAEADAMRWKVAAKFQVSDEDADLFLTGTDEETLTKQAQRLTGLAEELKKNGNHVPREGGNPRPEEDEDRAAARAIFNPT